MSMARELGAEYLASRVRNLKGHYLMDAAEWLDETGDPDFEVFRQDVEDHGPEFQEFWAGYDEALSALVGGGQ